MCVLRTYYDTLRRAWRKLHAGTVQYTVAMPMADRRSLEPLSNTNVPSQQPRARAHAHEARAYAPAWHPAHAVATPARTQPLCRAVCGSRRSQESGGGGASPPRGVPLRRGWHRAAAPSPRPHPRPAPAPPPTADTGGAFDRLSPGPANALPTSGVRKPTAPPSTRWAGRRRRVIPEGGGGAGPEAHSRAQPRWTPPHYPPPNHPQSSPP
eukprot:scaffold1365_cov121-Isochrysis_galbana.AAC.2